MNIFKSSFFTDFNLQDVFASSQDDAASTSANSETVIASAQQDFSPSVVEDRRDSPSEVPYSGTQRSLSSDSDDNSSGSATKIQGEPSTGMWTLGTLVKSIASKSDGIIQAYRKDLEEFGSGLKKETQLLAEVASHAVKELPTSLESGAYIAQESIESVGQVVEEFSSSVWRGTAGLIAQGKDAVLQIDDDEVSVPIAVTSASSSMSRYDKAPIALSAGKYSRFEAQVSAMQHDSSTYCDEPGDATDYNRWKSTFSLSDKKEDIENLLAENTLIQELLRRFVPQVVSEDIFWTRYFYRLYKLKQTEEARADLVKRASAVEDEDLSWDTEEEFEEGMHDEKYLDGKAPDNPEPLEKLHAAGTDSLLGKPSVLGSLPQGQIHDAPINEAVSKRIGEEEEEDLGWEVPEDVDESSSNDGKRSSNSEASWEVPDVPKEKR